MKSGRSILVTILALIGLFFLGQFLFTPKAIVSSGASEVLSAPKLIIVSLLQRSTLLKQMSSLSIENQSLKAQILELEAQPTLLRQEGEKFIVAKTYSQYPFGDLSQLLVNAGSREGVREGMPVLVAPGIFLGVVQEVKEKTSIVKTIYSAGWELPVKIGAQRVDALLVGAHEPKLTLISKNKVVAGGESVLLASREFPLGLTVGSVEHIEKKEEELFFEATMRMPYALNELNEVYIQLP